MPSTLNPQPSTLKVQPSTVNPQLSSFNPPSTLNLQPSPLTPKLSTPQPSTLTPLPSTLNPQPSTLSLQPSNLTPFPPTLNSQLNVVMLCWCCLSIDFSIGEGVGKKAAYCESDRYRKGEEPHCVSVFYSPLYWTDKTGSRDRLYIHIL